jgi:hypothetical protein
MPMAMLLSTLVLLRILLKFLGRAGKNLSYFYFIVTGLIQPQGVLGELKILVWWK